MRAFKKFNIDVGQNFSERRLCSRVWKNGKMTEVNVAQEVLAAGQKRARDFAALLGIEHPVLNAPMPVEAGVELVAADIAAFIGYLCCHHHGLSGPIFFHQPDERRTN